MLDLPPNQPNCRIAVVMDVSPNPPTFTHFCIAQPPGWNVNPDGYICPTTRSRIIQLELSSHPAGAVFTGYRFATTPEKAKDGPVKYNDTKIEIKEVDPTTLVVNANDPSLSERVWYSLGVTLNGVVYWNDPKIYNPPDD